MINVDELPALERPVAHTAGVLLRIQQAAELFLSQPVASDPVLSVGLLSGLAPLAPSLAPRLAPRMGRRRVTGLHIYSLADSAIRRVS